MRIDMPIVKVFGNGLNDPGGLVGNPNIGRCIFEDTRLEKVDDKLANCDVVVCVSRWNADLLREKTAKRIEVIHEGVDETLFKPGPRTQRFDHNKFYIFNGGKVEYRKGHDLVLLAFSSSKLDFRSSLEEGLAIGRIDLFCFGFGKRPEGERHVLHPVRMILPDQNLISVLDLTDCCLC